MSETTGRSLVKKLGIKNGFLCLFVGEPDHYGDLLEDLPPIELAEEQQMESHSLDFVHAFFTEQHELTSSWEKLKSSIHKSGMIWISWPKGSSALRTDLNGNVVRKIGLDSGLVDVKVCAVDQDWSAIKFMYRKEDR